MNVVRPIIPVMLHTGCVTTHWGHIVVRVVTDILLVLEMHVQVSRFYVMHHNSSSSIIGFLYTTCSSKPTTILKDV